MSMRHCCLISLCFSFMNWMWCSHDVLFTHRGMLLKANFQVLSMVETLFLWHFFRWPILVFIITTIVLIVLYDRFQNYLFSEAMHDRDFVVIMELFFSVLFLQDWITQFRICKVLHIPAVHLPFIFQNPCSGNFDSHLYPEVIMATVCAVSTKLIWECCPNHNQVPKC
jgi:hypothetical protein